MAENNDNTNSITLKLHIGGDAYSGTTDNKKKYVEMVTGTSSGEATLIVPIESKNISYKINIQDIKFTKKIYSPNTIIAELQIAQGSTEAGEVSGENLFLSRKLLETIFLDRQVELYCNGNQENMVGSDFYVHKISPRYTKTYLYVTMSIYSPDYQLTVEECCQMFVAKKMSEIITDNKKSYVLPYDKATSISVNDKNMQHFVTADQEHIFPYLVQYNESYYDFLKRTSNRWGEFLYYESGELHIGYDKEATPKKVDNYESRSYNDVESTADMDTKTKLHPQATADANFLDNPMEKDKYEVVKNQISAIADSDMGQDKYIMAKISSFLTNNKSLVDWIFDTLIADGVALWNATKKAADKNGKYNDTYFSNITDSNKVHYNASKTKYNQFSEFDPVLDAKWYTEILGMELTAGSDVMKLDFQTTWPGLKLGQFIEVEGEQYIVIEINGYQPEAKKVCYDVTCLPKATLRHSKVIEKDGKKETIYEDYIGYYPYYLPSGHIREAGLQHATVMDVNDPLRANRVRVKFDWQSADDKALTPWLHFAQSAATKSAGVHGRHYKDETVLVDYISNNVERPYVVGAVCQKVPTPLKTGSAVMMSPQGQGVRVSDGTGAGLTAFVASMNPGLKLAQSFFPGKDLINFANLEESPRFEGSTEICDMYGIYSIKGSTDGRNITIKSPWGDVKMNAFTGITISAPNGDVKIQGKNVSIEAGNNLKITSGTNIKNKFFSRYGDEYNAAMIIGDVANRVNKKILTMGLSSFDLSLIRNILEVGFKPQEGTLEVKSNRFLKLSAGGSSAGFPDTLYKDPKAKAKEMVKDNGTLNMGPAIAELIKKIDVSVETVINRYITQYKDCVAKKQAFDNAINDLKNWANPLAGGGLPKVCKDYEEIKPLLWKKGTKEITQADMGFVDKETNDADRSTVSWSCYVNSALARDRAWKGKEKDTYEFVLRKRRHRKRDVLKCANELLESIHKLMNVSLLDSDVNKNVGYAFGFFTKYVPADYISVFKKAFTSEKCKAFRLYKYLYGIDDNGHETGIADFRAHLLDDAFDKNYFLVQKKAFKRRVALNMLSEWGIDGQKPIWNKLNNQGAIEYIPAMTENGPGVPVVPAKPESEADLANDVKWHLYIESLVMSDLSLIKNEKGNFITTEFVNAWDKMKFLKPYGEYSSWGSAKSGKILFADTKTYELGSEIRPINAKYVKGKINNDELRDKDKKEIEGFMRPIRVALDSLDRELVLDVNVADLEIPNQAHNLIDDFEVLENPDEDDFILEGLD
jgi:hypothetical protein